MDDADDLGAFVDRTIWNNEAADREFARTVDNVQLRTARQRILGQEKKHILDLLEYFGGTMETDIAKAIRIWLRR